MELKKVPYYIEKAKKLGALKTGELLFKRIKTSFFEKYKRHQAYKNKAAFTWEDIAKKELVNDFPFFLLLIKQRSFSFLPDMYKDKFSDKKKLLNRADQFTDNSFDILGSGLKKFKKIDWHSDFRLKDAHRFDKKSFYKDIVITFGKDETLVKDIKIPWEISRFNHVTVLGAAYQETGDEKYASAFKDHINSFIDENPYLLGPNWVCPMDVGIRAINWIWGFHYFKNSDKITEEEWEKVITSLYNHMVYLENNWEIGAITSNHYLSDLIGYFYLTWFFSDVLKTQKNHEWCYDELLKEFEKQIFDEGTDYEGSTNYHLLVTEIFYNFYFVCQESGLPIPEFFIKKLKRMFSFLYWCTPLNGTLIKIGDDDSGKIVDGLPLDTIFSKSLGVSGSKDKEKIISARPEWFCDNKTVSRDSLNQEIHYKKFGLSILKTEKWHISLRHHVYQNSQPSGHFHNDACSVTVAVNGIPVLVDSGSYVYTPSAVWRNRFRSIKNHNTFFIKDKEPTKFNDESLFVLEQPEKTKSELFVSKHNLYGIEAKRVVTFNEKQQRIKIVDQWNGTTHQETGWNFLLGPDIVPTVNDQGWDLLYKNKKIVTLVSDSLEFKMIDGWYAQNYGTKVPCKQLVAYKEIDAQEQITIHLRGG